MAIVHKTFQVRGFLSRRGYVRLDTVLRRCATLYNAGLEEWREAYRMTGVSLGYLEQFKEFTSVRGEDPFWNEVDARVGRGVLRRLDRARTGFYRRVKEGAKAGYPRFKSGKRWRTIELDDAGPSMVRNGQVRVKGLPPIEIRPDRKLPPSEQLKSLKITRAGRRVTVNLVYAVEHEVLPPSSTCVGVSLEGGQRATLSDGTAFRTSDRHRPDIIRKHQRLARCKKDSRGVDQAVKDIAQRVPAAPNCHSERMPPDDLPSGAGIWAHRRGDPGHHKATSHILRGGGEQLHDVDEPDSRDY